MAAEAARAWLAAAEDDLRAVTDCLHGPEPTPTAAAYHCQQAAEKLVKAVLVSADIHPPKSHDIGGLVDRLGDAHPLHATLAPLARFAPYAWLFRYPSPAPAGNSSAPPVSKKRSDGSASCAVCSLPSQNPSHDDRPTARRVTSSQSECGQARSAPGGWFRSSCSRAIDTPSFPAIGGRRSNGSPNRRHRFRPRAKVIDRRRLATKPSEAKRPTPILLVQAR